jgi:hypothetical protein
LGDDGVVSIITDTRMGMLRVAGPDEIAHHICLDDLDQPRFRQVFDSYVKAMLAPARERHFTDT